MDSNITFIALTVCGERALFMKRNQEPRCWGPPSGHLKVGEAVLDGIRREMREETGLECRVLMPVAVWQGPHRGQDVFNVTFVCEVDSEAVALSEEHSDYRWVALDAVADFQRETVLDLRPWPVWVRAARECAGRLGPL